MENPQDVSYSMPWSWQGRAAFGCFLFSFVTPHVLRWYYRSTGFPHNAAGALYLLSFQGAVLLAQLAVFVLFVHRIQSSWDSPYAADSPHWAKWVMLLAVTLICAWWSIIAL